MSVNELEEQHQGIAVARLSVVGQVSFGDEVLEQKAADPWTEQQSIMHGVPPHLHSLRSGGRPVPTALASCSSNVACRANPYARGR